MNAIKVDDLHRIQIPVLEPGDLYEPEFASADVITLRRVEAVTPRPANVRMEKREGYTVGVSDQPINMAALKEALAEFP